MYVVLGKDFTILYILPIVYAWLSKLYLNAVYDSSMDWHSRNKLLRECPWRLCIFCIILFIYKSIIHVFIEIYTIVFCVMSYVELLYFIRCKTV